MSNTGMKKWEKATTTMVQQWTNNEVELRLNITLEYKAHKMQEHAI